MEVNRLDLQGMTCPVPVLETKKFLDGNPVDEIEIILDNDVAVGNVTRFLSSRGFSVTSGQEGGGKQYILKGARTGSSDTQTGVQGKKLLVFINGDTIGRGDDELGRVLMKSFLSTLKDLDVTPWRVVFVNGGVKLVAEGSECVNLLTELAGLGADILACGLCLDFFHIKEKVAVGRISNMYEIASSFLEATNVIKP